MRVVPNLGSAKIAVSVALALTLTGVSAGCREYREGVHDLPAEGEELPILRQFAGTHCRETRGMQVVVRDAATLSQIPLGDLSVDFASEMLLIVLLGRVASDLYTVSIDRAWREGHQLQVAVTVQSPPPGAPMVMASPYSIAVVPRCDLNVADFAPEPPPRGGLWYESQAP